MSEDTPRSVIEHLEELRWRLVKSAIAIVIGAIVAFIVREWIFDVLARPYRIALPGQDLNQFDERIVNRMVGLPGQIESISSLTDYEERKRGLVNPEAALTTGRGVLGALMQKIASVLHWFEESLVLKGSGEGLINGLQIVGGYLVRIDYLFSRPRYLWLIILLTLLVVF